MSADVIDIFLYFKNISPHSYNPTCQDVHGPPSKPLVRTAHDCETGLLNPVT